MVAVPQGASGIMMQGDGYWSFDGEMTDANQGFKLFDTLTEIVWFNNHVQNIYFYGSNIRYQFLNPVGY